MKLNEFFLSFVYELWFLIGWNFLSYNIDDVLVFYDWCVNGFDVKLINWLGLKVNLWDLNLWGC